MAPTGKVLLVFGLLSFGLTLEFGGQVQSGELAEARAQVVAMLEEVKPELRSRRETHRIYKELKAKPKRDFYEETLFQQLEQWIKEPEFQKPKPPLLLATKATRFQADSKKSKAKKPSLVRQTQKKSKPRAVKTKNRPAQTSKLKKLA